MSVDCDFNFKAYLNYIDSKEMSTFVKYISEYDEDLSWYKDMYEQPLLLEEPKLKDAIAFVRNLVK
jgi:hypothetical protein